MAVARCALRLLAGAAACLLGSLLTAGPGGLLAQTTLRIEPPTVVFPVLDLRREATIELWADNVPPGGIGSFELVLDAFNEAGFSPCVRYSRRELDPDLKAAWSGGSTNTIQTSDSSTIIRWTANSYFGFPGPSGTVRLGSITYTASAPSGNCFLGKQDAFVWKTSETLFGVGIIPDRGFNPIRGASWVLGRVIDVDLTLACNQTSPADPAFFVDGQRVTLECDIFNLGADAAQTTTNLLAVFSDDDVVDDGDFQIAMSTGVPTVPAGGSTSVTLTATPAFPVAQSANICVMIDADSFDLSDTGGDVVESDETNNVQCMPVTILEPQRDLIVDPASASVTPDPLDPSGLRAGLGLAISYREVNQGEGAVRQIHRNALLLGTDPASALADPQAKICDVKVTTSNGLPLLNGDSTTLTYGLGSGSGTGVCKIPFVTPPGDYVLVVNLDADGSVLETDPNGLRDPAEGNNTLAVPVTIGEPRPPEFRLLDRLGLANDHRVEITGPGAQDAFVTVASARDLASYAFRLTWSPPGLIALGDPNLPGGDPGSVAFSTFLESGGRTQSCAVTGLDPAAGTLDVACTTDPSSGPMGGMTEQDESLVSLVLTAVLPGSGTLTLSNLSATDSSGQPYSGLRITNGTYQVGGVPSVYVRNAVTPLRAFPGPPFTAGFDLENDGFGQAVPPILVDVVISRDAVHDPADPLSGDLLACTSEESSPLPGKTVVSREVSGCAITENVRPGVYTAFFQPNPLLAVPTRTTASIPLPSRVVALRKTSNGRMAVVTAGPDGPGGSTGPWFARAKRFAANSLAVVGSASRNRNWLVRTLRPQHGRRMIQIQQLPLGPSDKPEILREVRLGKEDRLALGAADIDGDGDQEVILLQRSKHDGDRLDFRRLDYGQDWPPICLSAAVSSPFSERVVSATGIQLDADPEDELAVVTRDGALTLYDLSITGPMPPPSPCNGTPTLLVPPAAADLTLLAGDPGFGAQGDRVRSICVLDLDLDGVEEIAALHEAGSGRQALRVYQPPAAVGGSALLVADDEEFGGTGGRGKALAITCTR